MNTLAMWMPGPTEMIVIGVVAVLIFGRRLPEVGKNLGRSLVEFKSSLKGTKDDVTEVADATRDVTDAMANAGEEDETTIGEDPNSDGLSDKA